MVFYITLEGVAALLEVFLALVFLEPRADFVFGLWRFNQLDPVAVWPTAVFGAQNFYGVACLQAVIKRHNLAIDLGTYALVANFCMHTVSKVQRRGACWQFVNLARRRKDKDGIAKELELDVVQKFLAVHAVLLQLLELLQPIELVGVGCLLAAAVLLVQPMGCNPVFGNLVHFEGTNLNFEAFATWANNGGVQRLVQIGLWHSNIVLNAPWHGLPQGVHKA